MACPPEHKLLKTRRLYAEILTVLEAGGPDQGLAGSGSGEKVTKRELWSLFVRPPILLPPRREPARGCTALTLVTVLGA